MSTLTRVELALMWRAENFYGDILTEFAQANGADAEKLSSGEWVPSKAIMKEAFWDALGVALLKKEISLISKKKIVAHWCERNIS